jgi:hypothetical protein
VGNSELKNVQEVTLDYDAKLGWHIIWVMHYGADSAKKPMGTPHDLRASEIAEMLNHEKGIVGDAIDWVSFVSPTQVNISVGDCQDPESGTTQMRSFHYDRKAGWQLVSVKNFELRITNVERKELASRDIERFPKALTKWEVTTELTNRSQGEKLFCATPYYGGSVIGRADYRSYLASSHVPPRDRHDFFWVSPTEKLVAKHVVYATEGKMPGKYVIEGCCWETINTPPDINHNFAMQWSLSQTPVGNDFAFSVTLIGSELPYTSDVLGEDFRKLWVGELVSKPVKMRVFEE